MNSARAFSSIKREADAAVERGTVARRRVGDGLVVGRAGRRHQALRQAGDRRLLHALRGQAPRLRRQVRLPRRRQLRGDPGGSLDRGDRQHHAQQRAPGNHPGRGRGRQARVPRQADRQHGRRRPRHRRGLQEGRRGAGARLSAPAREPLPLDQGRDRRRALRQAGAGRVQHQPRPARPLRPRRPGATPRPACRAA